jgi:hypothetical protein
MLLKFLALATITQAAVLRRANDPVRACGSRNYVHELDQDIETDVARGKHLFLTPSHCCWSHRRKVRKDACRHG